MPVEDCIFRRLKWLGLLCAFFTAKWPFYLFWICNQKHSPLLLYTSPLRGMRNIAISVPLCMSMLVCPLAYLKNCLYKLHQILCAHVTVARPSSNDNASRCVLPVLWMTSCFHIMRGRKTGNACGHVIWRFSVFDLRSAEAMSAIIDYLAGA